MRAHWEDVTLRLPSSEEADELGRAASEPDAVLPAEDHLRVSWLSGRSSPEIHARIRGTWSGWELRVEDGRWECPMAIIAGGRVVGVQTLGGWGWPDKRTITTGSWILASHQGRGIGTTSRRLALEIGFALGAEKAMSFALVDNWPSRRVSERLGYKEAGTKEVSEDGRTLTEVRYRLERADWVPLGALTDLSGLEALR